MQTSTLKLSEGRKVNFGNELQLLYLEEQLELVCNAQVRLVNLPKLQNI